MPAKQEFKFEPIQRDPIVVELTKKLLDYIFSGSVKPGDRLPTERQLQDALGVGRSAIREALKVLNVLGILEIRQGDGTYLRKMNSSLLTRSIEWGLLLGGAEIMEIVEMRRELEVSIARFAARRRTAEEVEELKRILDEMKTSDVDQFVERDIQFHLKLAEMARNNVMRNVLVHIQSLLRTWIKCVIEAAKDTDFSYEYHLAIYKAGEAGDPEGAAQAMASHLEDATARLVREIEKMKGKEPEKQDLENTSLTNG